MVCRTAWPGFCMPFRPYFILSPHDHVPGRGNPSDGPPEPVPRPVARLVKRRGRGGGATARSCMASAAVAAHRGPRLRLLTWFAHRLEFPPNSGLSVRILRSPPMPCGHVRRRSPPALEELAEASSVTACPREALRPAGAQALAIHWSGRLRTKIHLKNVTYIFQWETITLQ